MKIKCPFKSLFALILSVLIVILSSACSTDNQFNTDFSDSVSSSEVNIEVSTPSKDTDESKPHKETNPFIDTIKIPEYSGKPYVTLNGNKPNFTNKELKNIGYENYSSLDELGRCGKVIASLGKDTMPKEGEKRKSISGIYPSGWKQAKYDIISGKYLYNRCHLIGWQLSAENANRCNLITGTKYINIKGMLPFENMVADYIKETNNHVAYRVTPLFIGNNLVCSGVQIEAQSVEDKGEGIRFNVYCYNVQPGITIDYATGSSHIKS